MHLLLMNSHCRLTCPAIEYFSVDEDDYERQLRAKLGCVPDISNV